MNNKKNLFRLIPLLLATLVIFLLCACGAKKASPADTVSDTEKIEESAICEEAQNSSSSNGKDLAVSEEPSNIKNSEIQTNSDKIIYSGSADVETLDFEQTLADVERLVSEVGGFIQSSSIHDNDFYTTQHGGTTYRSAHYELRIPVEKFNGVMNGLSSLGNVPYSSVEAENITEQYTDTEARLASYEAEEARLLELLSKASTVDEILKIESHLSDIRYKIENLTSQLKNWDSRISYSSLTLNINEVSLYTVDAPATMNYGKQLSTALISSAKSVWHFLKDLLKFIVSALPVLAVVAIIAIPVFFFVRRIILRKKSEKSSEINENRGNKEE